SDLFTIPGIINVDFADVRTIMADQGRALMGMGFATEEGRAVAAAQQAINSPLLEDVTIQGAEGILINITSGPDLKLHEVEEAASLIQEAAHEDCNIIFGAVIDHNMGEALRITVIATGFDQHMPAEEIMEEAIKTHSGRRRQSQQVMATGMMGPGGRKEIVTHAAPAPVQRQTGLFSKSSVSSGASNPTPTPVPRKQAPIVRKQAPVAGESVTAGRSGSSPSHAAWSRVDGNAPDPSEIPAFLRRRNDDGYVR
nr:cell division protein FtsZ [Deltaproteobacteria bacterium]